jgi:hypothetical protein
VSDQESTSRPAEDEDVEAHGKNKSKVMASEEAPKDDESDDDVELHGRRGNKAL